ncbi:MAG: hypothetical protein OXI01_17380 [Albidovulum sp.]|nr:hypothetical protein [Albidovulum sp.]
MVRILASEIHGNIVSAKFMPAIAAGVTGGLGLIVSHIALGTFIYSGELSSWSSQGVVTLMTGAVITSACILLIGRFLLAIPMRFIPFPVAGGFVAGIGGPVCLAALSQM